MDRRVRVKERYAHGQGVAKYLARYVKGGPISDNRISAMDEQQVRFRYQDHRDGKQKGRVALGHPPHYRESNTIGFPHSTRCASTPVASSPAASPPATVTRG